MAIDDYVHTRGDRLELIATLKCYDNIINSHDLSSPCMIQIQAMMEQDIMTKYGIGAKQLKRNYLIYQKSYMCSEE